MSRIETPISFLFSGQFRSSVKRPGSKESITFEPFNCVQVEVDHRFIHTLEDALNFLTRVENIENSLTKRITIDRLPYILVIQMKRFVFKNGSGEKVSKAISFPEKLILDQRVYHQATPMHTANQPSYRLFAVVNHHGRNSHGGHYTVDVRKSFKQDELWIRLNDTFVNKVPLEQVIGSRPDASPYLLFYQRTKDYKHNL